MLGADFLIFWQIGRAILEGHSPYTVEFSRYPPAAAFFFVLMAALPYTASFAAWSGLNVAIYLHRLRKLRLGRAGWLWLLYTPFLFNLLTGQLDILFWWAAFMLRPPRRDGRASGDSPRLDDWIPALAAAFFTLKPQLAAVVLPWFLVRWLLHEKGLLLRWAAICAVLHTLPLLYDGQIYVQWLQALSGVSEMKMAVSSGIFALSPSGAPLWLLGGIGAALAVWGLLQDEVTSRAAQLTAFPITIWYDDILLAGAGPVGGMVALSWLAFVGAAVAGSSLPLAAIPAGTLAWLLFQRQRAARESARSAAAAHR